MFEALRVGASGFLVKDTEPEVLPGRPGGGRGRRAALARRGPAADRGVRRGAGHERARVPRLGHRCILATVMFSDIVASTERAAAMGDRSGGPCSTATTSLIRRELAAHGRAARSRPPRRRLPRAVRRTRPGHPLRGGHPHDARAWASTSGSACTRARSSCVGTTSAGSRSTSGPGYGRFDSAGDVVVFEHRAGSGGRVGIGFVERGEQALKGVPDRWRLFAVADPGPGAAPGTRTNRRPSGTYR